MRWLSYYRTQTVLVYPRTIHFRLPASSQSSATGLGQNLGPLTPGSEEFSHLRPFLPGDLMARIHWKSSIKTRSLKTRQYTDPSGESCLIFIDTQKISKEADRIADQVTECAAALLYAHLVQEDSHTSCLRRPSHMRSYQNHFLFPTIIDAINGLLCCRFVKKRKKPARRHCMP